MPKNKVVNKITFSASVAAVKTLVDGGIRVTLDLPEDTIRQVAMLMECNREMIPLRVVVMADEEQEVSIGRNGWPHLGVIRVDIGAQVLYLDDGGFLNNIFLLFF